jgi:putative transcriptional regulator
MTTDTPRLGGSVRSDLADGAAGERIRSRRKAASITQQAMAEAVGVSRQTIIAMETGDYAPSVYLALKISSMLDSSVEEIWGP